MKAKNKETNIYLLPIFLLLAIQPLFLRLYEYDNGLGNYAWIGQSEGCMDLFLHGKMVLFEILCACAILGMLCYLFQTGRKIHLPKAFLLLFGYGLLAFLSTALSDYRSYGFSGIYEQFENIWCLLGYIVIIVITYCLVLDMKAVDFLMNGVLICALFIGMIGFFQFIGHDLLMTDFAKLFYIPAELKGTSVNVAFGTGMVYMTLYNPGYVGLYTSLICPLLLVRAFYEKKPIVRILCAVACLMLAIGTYGTHTIGGMIGLGVSFAVLCVLLLKTWSVKKCAQVLRCILCVILVAGICVISISHTGLSIAAVENMDTDENIELSHDNYPLQSISETDEYVEFCYNGVSFRESMRIENGAVVLDFTDTSGAAIDYDYDEGIMLYTLTEAGLEGITSYSANLENQYIAFVTSIDGKDWVFTNAEKDGTVSYYMINALLRLDKNITSESAIFNEQYHLFNGRGYIWAKTIPLLKEHLLLGSGADSFALVFPQSDYLDAYKGGYENMVITKPHCLYLQVAVQTGIVSLLLLLAFYLWYSCQCMKLYWWKKIENIQSAYAIAIFAGSMGFLVVSIINDSTICVTPVFAALLGIGLAINRMCAQTKS